MTNGTRRAGMDRRVGRVTSPAPYDAARLAELHRAGKGDTAIASKLKITRHQARKGIAELQRRAGEIILPDPAPDAPPEAWAERIAVCWRKSFQDIVEAGRLLIAAKRALPHGRWQAMVQSGLPFGKRTAQMLIKIAGDRRLTNPNHGSLLPPHWRTAYELTKLDDATFAARMADGTINPDMDRRAIATTIKQERRAARERELGAMQLAVPDGKYGVIVEDYEWDHVTWSELGRDRSAENHYPVGRDAHTAQEIVERTKDRFACSADDCVCFMWSTLQHAAIAMDVLRLRGFDYKSQHAWGKDKIGLGHWNREKHEILLIGVKGDIPCPAPGEQWDSLIMARRAEHSAKPECFLEMIEQYFPTLPKIELNRRGPARPGWAAWGFEADAPTGGGLSGAGTGPFSPKGTSPDLKRAIAIRLVNLPF